MSKYIIPININKLQYTPTVRRAITPMFIDPNDLCQKRLLIHKCEIFKNYKHVS